MHHPCIIRASSVHHLCIIRPSTVHHPYTIHATSVHHPCIIDTCIMYTIIMDTSIMIHASWIHASCIHASWIHASWIHPTPRIHLSVCPLVSSSPFFTCILRTCIMRNRIIHTCIRVKDQGSQMYASYIRASYVYPSGSVMADQES